MLANDEARWAQLDARIAAEEMRGQAHRTAEIIPLVAPSDSAAVSLDAGQTAQAPPDWTTILDTIAAARATLLEQETRQQEQAAAHDALRRELNHARSETAAYRTLVQEQRQQTRAKEQEIGAQAEARIQAIQMWAQEQVSAAEERTRAAEQRAEAAEDWLRRVEQATRDLLPSA